MVFFTVLIPLKNNSKSAAMEVSYNCAIDLVSKSENTFESFPRGRKKADANVWTVSDSGHLLSLVRRFIWNFDAGKSNEEIGENRPEIAAQHSHENMGAVTSILASMWRSMPTEKKMIYAEFARQFDRIQVCPVKHSPPTPAPPPKVDLFLPLIHVVRRIGSSVPSRTRV
jgi:hypothetical protein